MKPTSTYPIEKALQWLFKAQGVAYTPSHLAKTTCSSPDYPHLNAAVATLDQYSVDNLTVKIDRHQLADIPYPALAHTFRNGQNELVVLTGYGEKEQQISYRGPEGAARCSLNEFTKIWTGNTILTTPTERSGEKNFYENRRKEWLHHLGKAAFAVVVMAIAVLSVINFAHDNKVLVTALYATKALGVLLSIRLISVGWGHESRLCHIHKQTSCKQVLNSPAAKIFNISLSELGLCYFSGGLMSLFILSFSAGSLAHSGLGVLLLINLLTLPYSLFSIGYQYRVVKYWCPLCLAVMALLWTELFLLHGFFYSAIDLKGTAIILAAFSLTAMLWAVVRKFLRSHYELPRIRHQLKKFKTNHDVFLRLLEKAEHMGSTPRGIVLGNPGAPVVVTVVTNPVCAPCQRIHQQLEQLLAGNLGSLKINMVLLPAANDPDTLAFRVSERIIAHSLARSPHLQQIINDWYTDASARYYEQWVSKYPVEINDQAADLLKEYRSWASQSQILVTPTLLFNSKKFPEEYELTDITYLLRKIESETLIVDRSSRQTG